jgi:hypothetical protein
VARSLVKLEYGAEKSQPGGEHYAHANAEPGERFSILASGSRGVIHRSTRKSSFAISSFMMSVRAASACASA